MGNSASKLIQKVDAQIEKVEAQIKKVEKQIDSEEDAAEKHQLRKDKEQLRKEKEQLNDRLNSFYQQQQQQNAPLVKRQKVDQDLMGSHKVDLSVNGLVAYIKSLQEKHCVVASPVRLHDDVDLAFELRDREDTQEFYVGLLKRREAAFHTVPRPLDRTKYPMAVFSGMSGLGKT
eukprot:scaffold140942_cov41-Attheya_sp.AAC.1